METTSTTMNENYKSYCENNKINQPYKSSLIIDTKVYNEVVKKLRSFFENRGFLEVSTQNRLSIIAACEDPFNVSTLALLVMMGRRPMLVPSSRSP